MESTEPELDHVRILCNQLPREAPKQYQSTHAVFSFQFSIFNFQNLNSIHKFPNSSNLINIPFQREKQVVVMLQFVHQVSLFSAIANKNYRKKKSCYIYFYHRK